MSHLPHGRCYHHLPLRVHQSSTVERHTLVVCHTFRGKQHKIGLGIQQTLGRIVSWLSVDGWMGWCLELVRAYPPSVAESQQLYKITTGWVSHGSGSIDGGRSHVL